MSRRNLKKSHFRLKKKVETVFVYEWKKRKKNAAEYNRQVVESQ